MAGFRLTTCSEGQSLQWERNPYYYEVSKDGDQLPYVDKLLMTVVQDPQVGKVQMSNGQVDYVHGPFIGLALADVQTLQGLAEKNQHRVLLWDTGTGTASMMFAQPGLQGSRTTANCSASRSSGRRCATRSTGRRPGSRSTSSRARSPRAPSAPRAIEFVGSAEGKKYYEDWKDSYVEYDVEKAKSLLDELGLKDKDGDGMREFPDGKKLSLRIDLPGRRRRRAQGQGRAAVPRLEGKVGLKCVVNPVAADRLQRRLGERQATCCTPTGR